MSAPRDDVDQLRTELSVYFARVPEPPVYRRRDDPAKQLAQSLVTEGRALLERLNDDDELIHWREALQAHVEAQSMIAEGRLEAAEAVWRRAIAAEQRAANERRVWARSDEHAPAVYSRESGESRFDPRPEPTVQVKLICPLCRTVGDFAFSPRHATHRFNCLGCKAPFQAYIGELKALEIDRQGDRARRYMFRIDELSGQTTRIHFDDASEGELGAARRDLLAFLYAPSNHLRGVLNLSSSRVLWIQQRGFCFVASAVLGDDAPELDTFRAFRDRVLMPWVPAAVETYYRHGPAAARWLSGRPRARRVLRVLLRATHAAVKAASR
ncbi:MAG: hypothetical protein JNK82_16075 [Myxococcaceae bacterium]|nr:hypothetical protein [Myxococcaceae bacterium]